MTDKQRRRLSRAELPDILYEQQKRYEKSLTENQALRQQTEERTLRIASAGSIAEASARWAGFRKTPSRASVRTTSCACSSSPGRRTFDFSRVGG